MWSTPVPVPGTASRDTADRSPNRAKNDRKGTYSPNGTRWTFSYRSTTAPWGPKATISLRNEVAESVSVTPTTRVEWSD